MIRLRSALAAMLISISVVQYAQATITNGRFETGDFTGWTVGGNSFGVSGDPYHTITGTGFGLGPIQGTSSALVVSRSSTVGLFSCNDPFGGGWAVQCPLPPGVAGLPNTVSGGTALTYPFVPPPCLIACGPYESWIGQDIQGLAGDEIDLSLQYMTNEDRLGAFDDFAVFATRCSLGASCIFDPSMFVYSNFVRADFANCPQVDPNSTSTGFRFASAACDVRLTLPTDALWTLYIGAVQGYGDNIAASGILVDNVRQLREVVAVPNPSTLPLLLLGIGLAGLARSRSLTEARGTLVAVTRLGGRVATAPSDYVRSAALRLRSCC